MQKQRTCIANLYLDSVCPNTGVESGGAFSSAMAGLLRSKGWGGRGILDSDEGWVLYWAEVREQKSSQTWIGIRFAPRKLATYIQIR